VELDRQSIERRDFPIVRRGYDPGIVNAHLAALADQVERGDGAARKSVAAIASGMVQSILEAAESTATDIERSAKDGADQLRSAAEQAAQSLRNDAIAKSRGHVSAVAGATEPMLERLHAGDIDVGILALPVRDEALAQRALYEEPFVLAMPESNPLGARAQVRIDDLSGETLLLLEDGHCLRDQALAVCARSGSHERADFRATSIETLRQMVAAGVGVTLLPALATQGGYGNAKGVVVLPFQKPAPLRRIGAVWRKSSARLALIGAVCEQLARGSGLGAAR